MEVTRKPPAKIEGRKRMQGSGLTVTWHGTRSLKDWVAYVEDGSEHGRLVLAHQVSERALKSLLVRIQSLSGEAVQAMGQPVEAVAQQGGGPPVRRPQGGSGESPGSGRVAPSSPGRQLALTEDDGGETRIAERPRRRRLAAAVESLPAADSRRSTRPAARDVSGTLRQLRSRVETLEEEQERLRADLALLRGDAEVYEGPPSIFVTGWFRATLVLIVLAIVVVITVPWLMDLFEARPWEPRPPVRTEAPAPAPPSR